jgi:hypothetical protein
MGDTLSELSEEHRQIRRGWAGGVGDSELNR